MRNRLILMPGTVVEALGDTVLVMSPHSDQVTNLSGDAASIVRAVHAGEEIDPSQPVAHQLVEMGILSAANGFSRRGLVKASAVGVGAGIAALTMPSVAMASSPTTPTEIAIPLSLTVDGISLFGTSTLRYLTTVIIPMGPDYENLDGQPEPLDGQMGSEMIPAEDIEYRNPQPPDSWGLITTADPESNLPVTFTLRFRWDGLLFEATGTFAGFG